MAESPRVMLHAESRFPIGNLGVTAGAREALSDHDIEENLNSHIAGQWGDLDKHDRQANERALREGGRLVSVYESEYGGRFYIITEADRSCTTILLPSEY